jgi:conjugative transfer pilus assembly protein TraH
MGKKVFISLALIGTITGNTFAGLTDYMKDSLNNIDENLAFKYYSTQERGYLLGGSWHYRVPNFTIYPFTFTPPSIKAGCGGIDIIMGGFSYLQPEYLVQKFQQMLQAAPAVAFEIALDTYAPQVKEILNTLDAIANMINQLNFNSCTVTRGLVTYTIKSLKQLKEATAGNQSAKQQATGSSEAFFSAIQKWVNDFKSEISKRIEKIKKLRNKKGEVGLSGTLLGHALENTGIGSDTKIAQLIRGILGDINFDALKNTVKNDGGKGAYVAPATQIDEELLTKWLTDNIKLTGLKEDGTKVQISFSSLKKQIKQDIEKLYNKMINGEKLTPGEAQRYLYLTYSDIPVVAYLKFLSAIGDSDLAAVVEDKMLDLITLDVVYGTLKAVVKAAYKEANDLNEKLSEQYADLQVVSEALQQTILYAKIVRK